MSKKRKYIGKLRSPARQTLNKDKRQRRYLGTASIAVLASVHSASKSVTLSELFDLLSEQNFHKREIKAAIEELLDENFLTRDGKRSFQLRKDAPLYTGILTQTAKGFGFLRVLTQPKKTTPLTRDVFIPYSNMGDARHGDTVLVKVARLRGHEKTEGVVISVLSEGRTTIGGIAMKKGRDVLVYPDDQRFPFTIKIDANDPFQPNDGDAVVVQYSRTALPERTLRGKILEILGPQDNIDTQLRLVIEKFSLPHTFSRESQSQAEQLSEPKTLDENRLDLRNTDHITIDGEDAKDFDDAICVIKNRRGFRLHVSIADVSHFVTPGSAIDEDAYERGTSVYFPGRVIPMLPEKLSNDLCSLVPQQDRFCVTATLDFDRLGKLQKRQFNRSVIRSQQRFTYTTVKEILVDKDASKRQQYKPFVLQLKWAQELAEALKQKRKKRGSVDFNLAEPEFMLSATGEVLAIHRQERNAAHQLIEEFMLAANEAVAEFFSEHQEASIFRIHEHPDPIKVENFIDFAKTLDLQLPPFTNTPSWFADLLDSCRETPVEYLVNNLVLRNMKQAQYSVENLGHFGLAATHYTHFTSPIRRYPDLMVHRRLLNLIEAKNGKKNRLRPQKEAAEFLSTREREAVSAERDMHDRLKISYMKKHLGDSFDAVVSGVNDSALFVEIPEHCISGSISLDQFTDDYYIFDEKRYRLFGEISAKTYRIGDSIHIVLIDADTHTKRLRFKPAPDTLP